MRLQMGNQRKKTEGGERWRGKKATNHDALEIGALPPPVSCPIAGGGGGGEEEEEEEERQSSNPSHRNCKP